MNPLAKLYGLAALLAAVSVVGAPARADHGSADLARDALTGGVGSGTLSEGIEALEQAVRANGHDDRSRFALGMARALRGFEILGQAAYRHGASSRASAMGGAFVPMIAMVPPNPQPEPARLEDLRRAVLDAMKQAEAADATLAGIDADFTLRLDIFAVRLDLNDDGRAGEDESIRSMLSRGRITVRAEGSGTLRELPVDFDRGDADWLRGYCHLTMGCGELMLAHDPSDLFARAGHVFFPENETEFGYLKTGRSPLEEQSRFLGVDPLDVIAMVHLIDFPVSEPARMARARGHFLRTIGFSRSMWAHYDAETDNADEWVPNPEQTAAFPGAVMDADMRGVWLRFLDDAEAVLRGEALLPFWRGQGELGLNVERVFLEPRGFDLILWIQGSAAAPYLEEGEQLDTQIWRDLEEAFERRTFRHMFWLN